MALRTPTRTERRPSYLIPSDRDSLIPWLEKRRAMATGRLSDVQMRVNLAYMLGHQSIIWDPGSRRLRRAVVNDRDPNPPAFVQVNKIGGIVERTVSKLTKNVPVPECRPVTDEDDDVSAARVGTRILSHELDRLKWEDLLTELYFWVIPIGWAYLYCCWDPEAGSTVGEYEGAQVNEGQIKLEIVPPFELMVDPNARRFDQARWAIRTLSMTREAVWETYGVDPKTAETGRTLADEVAALGAGARVGRESPSADFVFVHQFWLVPGVKQRSEGMVVTWAGEDYLEAPKPFPYEHGRLPFSQFSLLPGLGFHEGRTWCSDLVGMQKDYNDARSREAHLRRIMVPHLTGPAGSIDPNRLQTKVSWIPYTQVGNKPEWMIPDNRWAYQHQQAMDRADQEMGERAGQAEVSKGSAPAGAPAAAILALQEADDTKLAVSAKQLAKAVAETGSQVLNLARQYWAEDRLVRTWSEEGRKLEVRRFSGADIGNQLDVHVSSESALPRSKSARAQLVMDLVQMGVLQDPKYILRLLQMPGVDWLSEQLDLDTKQAQRENDKLITEPVGVEVPGPAPWHNHQAHIQAHDDMRKGIDYEKAPPEIRARIDAHCEVHYQAIGLPDAQAQMMGRGAPAGPPGVEGPPGGPEYLDPLTGQPSDPLARAAGQAAPARDLAAAAGIGGVGQPGQIPGVSIDAEAAAIGD